MLARMRLSSRPLALVALMATVACSGAASTGSGPDAPATTRSPAPAATGVQTPAEPAPTLSPSEPFSVGQVTLEGSGRSITVPVYVADAPALRQRGLMGRETLPAGTGMIFVFEDAHSGGFWMKDTLIPLSIAFLGEDGAVLEVIDMEPCTADPCPVYDPQVAYHYALEVNQGFLSEVGLGPGWRVDVSGIAPGSAQ